MISDNATNEVIKNQTKNNDNSTMKEIKQQQQQLWRQQKTLINGDNYLNRYPLMRNGENVDDLACPSFAVSGLVLVPTKVNVAGSDDKSFYPQFEFAISLLN